MFSLLGAFGLYLALTAIAETQGFSALVFPRYILSPAFPEFLGRGRGPLLNPAANGILLGLCLAAGLMAWPRTHCGGKLLLIAYSAIVCFAVYATLTRSAWLGGALGLFLVVFLAMPRRIRPWLLAAALLGATAVVGTQWDRLAAFKRDRSLSAWQTAESARLRPILAMAAWKMFLDRPLFGCGFGHYLDQQAYYLADRNVALPLERARGYAQHSVWLSLLTETGLVGMTLFTLLVITWLRNAAGLWRTTGAPLWMRQGALVFLVLATNYLVNGMFQDVSIIPGVHLIVFFLAGVAANLQAMAAEGRETEPPWRTADEPPPD
jgi:O-antigen ligase